MAASLQLDLRSIKLPFQFGSVSKNSTKSGRVRCAATSHRKRYSITLLPGDGIGPEVISVAKNVLELTGPLEARRYYTELKKIAERFEEKTYTGATSQSDYHRKISWKIIALEIKYGLSNPMPPNGPGNNNPQIQIRKLFQ